MAKIVTQSKRNRRRGQHFKDIAHRRDRDALRRREYQRRMIERAQAAFASLASQPMRPQARG
jgi:hypothetical protein